MGVTCGVSKASAQSVIPVTHVYAGRTYSDWSAAWWQWALSIPVHDPANPSQILNPLFDDTGAECGVQQSGPVFFLGGKFCQSNPPPGSPPCSFTVTRNCSVPA